MSLAQVLLRTVEAEQDRDRKYRFAAMAMADKSREETIEVVYELLEMIWSADTIAERREAANVVIQAIAVGLLGQIDALDSAFDELLEKSLTLEFGDSSDPVLPDAEGVYTIALDPEGDSAADGEPVLLDLWADPGEVVISMGPEDEVGPRLTGRLHIEDVDYLRRSLFLVMEEARDLLGEQGDDPD